MRLLALSCILLATGELITAFAFHDVAKINHSLIDRIQSLEAHEQCRLAL